MWRVPLTPMLFFYTPNPFNPVGPKLMEKFVIFSDADDAVHDLDGKDMQGGRVRVELARDPRDRRGGGGGGRFGGGNDRGGGRDGGRRPRGNPPGPRTNYRLVVENLSSRTSWQVRSNKKFVLLSIFFMMILGITN